MPDMDKISDVKQGQVVYVKSRGEQGPVSQVRASSLIVALLSGRVEVFEGDFELR
jgi:hypothetical protein